MHRSGPAYRCRQCWRQAAPILVSLGWIVAWCVVAVWLAGCAVGRITPAGSIECAALGRARCEVCVPVPVPVVVLATPGPKPTRAPTVCRRVTGGSLSGGLADTLEAAATAVGAYFGIGG